MDAETAKVWTIQEVARRSGFSEPTLRYYEQIGLIAPVPRDHSSGHRRYSTAMVETIEALACLRTSGLSIADMRDYLRFMAQGNAAAAEQRELFAKNAGRVAEEIERLQIRHRYLTAKGELWAARERSDTAGEAQVIERLREIIAALK